MKQILQNRKNGKLSVVEVSSPVVQEGRVLVRTAASLISPGTERAAVDEGKKTLFEKARERPELLKRAVEKAREEGVASTLSAIRTKLGSSVTLGYSAAGIVTGLGDGVREF